MNQGPPHPLRIQSCSLWWVCSQPRAWSCLCSAGILPETGVFSLLLAVQWFRFAGKGRGILLQLGCLCANVSFRAVWDEQRYWNAQPGVVVCFNLRWYPLKAQNWGTASHLPVRPWQLCMGRKPIPLGQRDVFCLVLWVWSSSLIYPYRSSISNVPNGQVAKHLTSI